MERHIDAIKALYEGASAGDRAAIRKRVNALKDSLDENFNPENARDILRPLYAQATPLPSRLCTR
jgi:hypothetical protein